MCWACDSFVLNSGSTVVVMYVKMFVGMCLDKEM